MSKVRETGESFDKKLDHWEASSKEFETRLQHATERALSRLEVRRKTLNEALERFKFEVGRAKGIGEERKKEIGEYFDDLEVQLALVKAEFRDAFKVQRKMIKYSIETLEATVGRHLDAGADKPLQEAADKFMAAAIEYEAEADALEAQVLISKAEARFEKKNSDLPAHNQLIQDSASWKKEYTRGQGDHL
jgi:hypothetical protein